MRIQILDRAEADLLDGIGFYERQETGLGSYFWASLSADIESLRLYAGIHRKPYRIYHRMLATRFPFAVYYTIVNGNVFIQAVVDCRRSPAWIRQHLKSQ